MIYLFLANGFEEIEAIVPKDIIKRAELDLTIVGVGSKHISDSHGTVVVCDTTDDLPDYSDIEAIILPGGMPGTLNLEHSQHVQRALDIAVEKGALLAAICAAPSILGHKNLLQGKTATCYVGFESQLYGAKVTGNPIEIDKNIITSRGPGTAFDFAFAIVKYLKGDNMANKIRSDILL